VKPNINSVEVHPHLRNNKHPVDDVLVGAGSLWPSLWTIGLKALEASKWKMPFHNLPNVFYLPQIQSVVKVYKNSLK
jgi:hypothetical protein